MSNRKVGDWVNAGDIDRAVDLYTRSIDQGDCKRSDYEEGNWCLDSNKNQVKGCRCVFDLKQKKMGNKNENLSLLSHAHVCTEMATWYSVARRNELLLVRGQLSQRKFDVAFHKTMTLKGHPQGSPTKMVDMFIKPLPENEDNEQEELYIPENSKLSVACFCLNSVLGIWKILLENKGDDMANWKSFNYSAILYQGGRNQMDCITQKKRQKLFYSRMRDVMAAGPEQAAIRQDLAAKCYQDSNELENDEEAIKKWKRNSSSSWKHWKLNSIRVLVANSSFKFSKETREIVIRAGIKISRVSDETTRTLQCVMGELWKQELNRSQRRYWRRVTQDKALFFFR